MTVQHGLWMSCQKRCIFYSCFDISAPKVYTIKDGLSPTCLT
uniref:Uncharacterized protein n=1 Tax=Ascaris lumbricoides TaxID=6252 RepID=A0A0M3HIF2_ASCLU